VLEEDDDDDDDEEEHDMISECKNKMLLMHIYTQLKSAWVIVYLQVMKLLLILIILLPLLLVQYLVAPRI
jgi:hypothetical protein